MIGNGGTRLYSGSSRCSHIPTFAYVMLPIASPHGNNKKNIIPCMIDFYCREKSELQLFYKRYNKCPLVLISSKEAYDFLVSIKCPLNIKHLYRISIVSIIKQRLTKGLMW